MSVNALDNDAAVIQAVLPIHTAKRLSRLISVPLNTAHCWIYRGLSASRRREVAMRLLIEMEKQDVARDSVRCRLVEWAGGNARGFGPLVSALRRSDPPVDDEDRQATFSFWEKGATMTDTPPSQ